MPLDIQWFDYNHNLNPENYVLDHPEKYVLKLSKQANIHGKRTLVVKEKGFLSFLEKHFYSGTFTYDLSKVQDALKSEYALQSKENETPSTELTSCLSIYEKNVIEYKHSLWTKLFGANPKITPIILTPKVKLIDQVGSQSLQVAKKKDETVIDQPPAQPKTEAPPVAPKPTIPEPSPEPKSISTWPLPPYHGIKVGLPNITDTGGFGNTCWLNSIIKFMCSGTDFDDMFTKTPPPKMKALQDQFKTLFSILRTGKTADGQIVKDVPKETYQEFLRALKRSIPQCVGAIGRQQEAEEFFNILGEALEWKPVSTSQIIQQEMNESGLFPRQAAQYIPTDTTPKDKTRSGWQVNSFPILRIKVSYESYTSKAPLDLNQLASTSEIIEDVKPDNPIKVPDTHPKARPGALRDESHDFIKQMRLTRLPPTMIVSLDRVVISPDIMYMPEVLAHPERYQKKLTNHILVDKDGLISFTEYKPIFNDQGYVAQLIPFKKCRYRIDAALTHQGGAFSGHYVCQVRPSSGQKTEHSDKFVTNMSDDHDFGLNGVLFRLTRVNEELIEQPPVVIPQAKTEEVNPEKTISPKQEIAPKIEETQNKEIAPVNEAPQAIAIAAPTTKPHQTAAQHEKIKLDDLVEDLISIAKNHGLQDACRLEAIDKLRELRFIDQPLDVIRSNIRKIYGIIREDFRSKNQTVPEEIRLHRDKITDTLIAIERIKE